MFVFFEYPTLQINLYPPVPWISLVCFDDFSLLPVPSFISLSLLSIINSPCLYHCLSHYITFSYLIFSLSSLYVSQFLRICISQIKIVVFFRKQFFVSTWEGFHFGEELGLNSHPYSYYSLFFSLTLLSIQIKESIKLIEMHKP